MNGRDHVGSQVRNQHALTIAGHHVLGSISKRGNTYLRELFIKAGSSGTINGRS